MFGSNRQRMKYPVKDDTYRDIYNQRDLKRGSRKTPISPVAWIIPDIIITGLISGLIFSLIGYGASFVSTSFLNQMVKMNPVNFLGGLINLISFRYNFFSLLAYGASVVLSIFADTLVFRQWKIQNVPRETQLVNNHKGDAYIEEPEALNLKYNDFPDAGAHSSVVVTAALSHQMITNGSLLHHIKHIKIAKRYKHDIVDENGNTIHKKGDMIRNNRGNVITYTRPMFDGKFSQELFDASKIPRNRGLWRKIMWLLFPSYYTNPGFRQRYNPFKLEYQPKTKHQRRMTVGQHINEDWSYPLYEKQRPAGVYITDDKPNNTIIIGKTRSAKGQTVINPTLDMWSRQNHKGNVVANDPKGELYLAFYKPYVMRGYNVMAFNLINESKTSIFNPLGYAWDAAIHGNFQKVNEVIDNLGTIFFPISNGQDKFWAQASNLVFKRSALELIDFYLDAYYEAHDEAIVNHWSLNELYQKEDELGGHVSLRNTYFMMKLSQYSNASPLVDPKLSLSDVKRAKESQAKVNAAKKYVNDHSKEASQALDDARKASNIHPRKFMSMLNAEDQKMIKEIQKSRQQVKIGNGKPKDYLSLLSEAEEMLPDNAMRDLIANQDGALNSMTQSEKTIASINGISLTEMNFFTDAKVSRLTSGRPSQNFDMASLGFPRRIQIRFDYKYMKRNALDGQRFEWHAYSDSHFEHPYKSSNFTHSGNVDEYGWASYIFKGILPKQVAYLRMDIIDKGSEHKMASYYFRFMKGYRKSVDGRTFVYNPITHKRIIQGGTLREMHRIGKTHNFKFENTTYKKKIASLVGDEFKPFDYHNRVKTVNCRAFSQTSIHYTEKPKAIFCVTPPNLAKYSKVILIMLDQMFNMQVSMAYTTKKDQKPLYDTNYMLDEVGNLRSDGKGIPFLTTKESIGLGQGQRYTLVVQDLQQFKDIYGQKADKTIEGNTGNFIYLKSTDIKMDQELSELSGSTYRTYHDNLSYTQNGMKMGRVGKNFNRSMTAKKENVLKLNDFLRIPPASSYTLGKGNPIASRNQDVMPMAYKLLGKYKTNYSLGTIPSSNDTNNFNAIQNQPDIHKLLKIRVYQARLTKLMTKRFKLIHGPRDAKGNVIRPMTDDEFNHLNPEISSREIMSNINKQIKYDKLVDKKRKLEKETADKQREAEKKGVSADVKDAEKDAINSLKNDDNKPDEFDDGAQVNPNMVGNDDIAKIRRYQSYAYGSPFAEGTISRGDMFITTADGKIEYNNPRHQLDPVISTAYANTLNEFRNDPHFRVTSGGSMYLQNSDRTPLILSIDDDNTYSRKMKKLDSEAKDKSNKKVNSTPDEQTTDSSQYNNSTRYQPTDEFYKYLAKQSTWRKIANGAFDIAMCKANKEQG